MRITGNSSVPAIDTVYSPPPSMLFSTNTVESSRAAASTAAASAWTDLTLVMPTLEPSCTGLTKSGKPSRSAIPSGLQPALAAHCTISNGGVGMPVCCQLAVLASAAVQCIKDARNTFLLQLPYRLLGGIERMRVNAARAQRA